MTSADRPPAMPRRVSTLSVLEPLTKPRPAAQRRAPLLLRRHEAADYIELVAHGPNGGNRDVGVRQCLGRPRDNRTSEVRMRPTGCAHRRSDSDGRPRRITLSTYPVRHVDQQGSRHPRGTRVGASRSTAGDFRWRGYFDGRTFQPARLWPPRRPDLWWHVEQDV